MRLRIIWTIFRKEIIETLRDRRTLLMMIGLPVLLYPMMIVGVSWFQRSQNEKLEERASVVAVWGEEAPQIVESLNRAGKLALKRWAGASAATRAVLAEPGTAPPSELQGPADPLGGRRRTVDREVENPVLAAARLVVADHTANAVLIMWPGLARSVADDGSGAITVYYDSVQPDSQIARDRLVDVLGKYRTDAVHQRERAHALPPGFSLALDILQRDVASEQRRSGQLLGMMLPFMLIAISLLGAFYPAIDVTAGEKERGTMQTLMCAPVTPHEIIVGKFLTVWTIALVAALANVVSLAATLARLLPATDLKLPLTYWYVATFGMLVPVTLTISALFLAVAAFARDFKDGQNFLTPVYMVVALPTVATMLPGVQLTATTAFLPVVNVALLIKSVMLSEAAPDLVFLALVASVTYSALALVLAARVFQQEQVLLGGQQSVVELLGLSRRAGRTATPGIAIVAFAIMLVVVFYGSLLLQHAGVVAVLLVTEYGFFLAPTLAIVFWLGFPVRDTLALRVPPLRALVGSVLVGVSAWAVAGGLLIRLLPPPDSLGRALERILLLDGRAAPLWIVWLVVGITPAVCEELFFRGFVLSGLRRLGILPAILASALLFGLAHSSIYRLLPTAFLGILFGYAVWRSGSVSCSVVAHALNNGLMATMVYAPAHFQWLLGTKLQFVPWTTTAAGCAVMAAGLLLIATTAGPKDRKQESAPGTEDQGSGPDGRHDA